MQYPRGGCESCGARLYELADARYGCLNCGERYPATYFEAVLADGGA